MSLFSASRVLSVILWFCAVVVVARFPIAKAALFAICASVAYWLTTVPRRWPIPVIIGLVLLNLAPWSGRFYFDAFDALILSVLGGVLWSWRPPKLWHWDRFILLVMALSVTSYLISLFVGLWSASLPDLNSFNNYLSPYNSVRVAKGFFWATCLFLPWLVVPRSHVLPLRNSYSVGMLLGLAGLIFVVVIEREMFIGLLDFDSDFRVTGTFWGMHTGGAYLDGFLVASFPFLLGLKLPRNLWYWALLAGLWIAAIYVIMVTYSRGLYLAIVVAAVVFLIARLSVRRPNWRLAHIIVLGLFSALLVIVPVLQGGYVALRFSIVEQDADTRMVHWKSAVSMMTDDPFSWLIGVGLGAYPRTDFWNAPEGKRAATYRLATEQDRSYLRLGSGSPLWMDQRINRSNVDGFVVNARIRGSREPTELQVLMCEKSLLYSIGCSSARLSVAGDGEWHETAVRMKAPKALGHIGIVPRFTVISLQNPHIASLIDIDYVAVLDRGQSDLLTNGTFEHGLDRWFMASDDHLAWHVKNLLLGVYFDQGLLGIFAFAAVFGFAAIRLIEQLYEGDQAAAV